MILTLLHIAICVYTHTHTHKQDKGNPFGPFFRDAPKQPVSCFHYVLAENKLSKKIK